MNKYLQKTKKILSSTCVVFSVLYFVFTLMSGAMGNPYPALLLKNSAILFLFALELCLCDLIFEVRKLKFYTKVFCHLWATFASALICLGLAKYSIGYKTLIFAFVFLFLYAIFCPAYIFIGKKHKKGVKVEKQSEYVSIFKKN